MEIDFLTQKEIVTSRHNISPIEVKSGKNYTLSSLNKFCKKFAEQTHIPYVLPTGDVKEEDGVVYLPLYMAGMIWFKLMPINIDNNIYLFIVIDIYH